MSRPSAAALVMTGTRPTLAEALEVAEIEAVRAGWKLWWREAP